MAYAVLVPVTYWIWTFAPGRGQSPLAMEVAVAHFIFCALIVALAHLLMTILESLHRARALRLRMEVFLHVFSVWPIAGAVWMALWKSL